MEKYLGVSPLMSLYRLALFAMVFSTTIMGQSNAVQNKKKWTNIDWSAPPAKGGHPRVLFNKSDIPLIRNNAETRIGKQLVARLKWEVNSPASSLIKKFKQNIKIGGNYDKVAKYAFFAALLHLITEERKYLDDGIVLLEICSDKLGPVPDKPTHVFRRGADCLVFAYDILYDKLPKKLRANLRGHFLSWLDPKANLEHILSYGYEMGPVRSGRPCDWGAISAGGAAVAYCAMEEEVPEGRKALEPILKMLRHIANYAIYPEGQMLSGNGYISGDFSDFFNAAMALKRRGVNLFDHPNISKIPVWLAYETVPNGYCFDNRNQSQGQLGLTPSIAALAANYDGCAKWIQRLALGPELRLTPNPEGAAVALIYGSFEKLRETPPKLPLTYFSSSMGTVFSRSGWKKANSTFTITMEPPGGGHTHRDKGSFTFYSHGVALAADGGVAKFSPKDHNTILVDGRGQLPGQGATDAIVRTQLSSDFADIAKMDVKPAFEQVLSYTNPSKSKINWKKLEYGKGLPFHWVRKNSFDRVDRFAIFVRSDDSEPYAVILDQVKKDDKPHQYNWLLQSALPCVELSPGKAVFETRHKSDYAKSIDGKNWLMFEGKLPQQGDYNIWLLVRTHPEVKQTHWFLSYMVNSKSNRAYLSHSSRDWQWLRLKPKGGKPWSLPNGALKVRLRVRRGGELARVVATTDLKFDPAAFPVESPNKSLELKIAPASLGTFWKMADASTYAPRFNVFFLRPETSALKINCGKKKKQPYLHQLRATVNSADGANFAALLLPENLNSKIRPKIIIDEKHPGNAIIEYPSHTDYLFANLDHSSSKRNGFISSDAKFALVRETSGTVTGYVMIEGGKLSFKGRLLAKCDSQNSSIVKGEKRIDVQAPQGSLIRFSAAKNIRATCNHQPVDATKLKRTNKLLVFTTPILPKEWKIDISEDGLTVNVVGDGPQPLKIHAPKAIKCVVNGISRFFSLDAKGNIFPKLEITVPTHGRDPYKSKDANQNATK